MAFPNQVLSCRNCKNNQNLKLETNEAGTFIVCRSCGCRTRLSQPKDEEKSLYFSRYTTGVNELRNLRFDLAAESFREAYGMNPDEPDALWGLVCAEYGIVQVMSYHDQKYSPVFCLVNYREQASFARNMHVLMLRELIDRGCKDHDIFDAWLRDVEKQIQKILEATPESHAWKWDVFIACKISETTETAPNAVGKTPEHEEALRLYEELTGRGLRVFYSEKYFVDNMGKPDSDWQIMSALLNSRQMLLVCGGERNDEKLNTPWVRSEWMRWRSMQKQGVKRDDSLIVYSISESTRSLPEGLFTGNTVYPSRRAELLQTLERNCYTDTEYDRDLRKGQELLSRSDFSEASRVFTHTAHMRPDRAEPHVYLFLCDLRVTRLSGLSEKHIESSPESNPHYREAEARNNRAFCELFQDLKDRIRFLRDQQKDGEMARMREKMEEMERQLQEKMKEPEHQPQEKTEKTEREERDKKEPPAPMPIQTVRYSQGLKFEKLEDGTYAVKGIGTCKDTELVIPPTTPEGGRVTAIGERAFYECSNLTSITIPDRVTTIGKEAFCDCDSLTSVTIPDSVTTIEESAFRWCDSLTSVTIPDSVTTIGKEAFYGCSSLISVTIPDSVTFIGWSAFSYCRGLTSIEVDLNNPKYYSQDNCVIDRASDELIIGIQTSRIPNGVTTIGSSAFKECRGLTSITIPDSVTAIGEWAFIGCSNLTSVTIPDSVTTIGRWAFSCCSFLTSVTIPDSVTEIGNYAFKACPNAKIYCAHPSKPSGWHDNWNPDNRPVVWNHKPGASAPAIKTPPQTVRYSQGLEFKKLEDGTYAVKGMGTCKDTELVIPSTTPKGGQVTSIERFAFDHCSDLTSVTIPNSVISLEAAFWGCTGLTSIRVEPNNPVYYCQDNCVIGRDTKRLVMGIQTSRIPNDVTSIGDNAFFDCSGLTSVTIPDGVTSIGYQAFRGCSDLTSVMIPNSVTTIEMQAFYDCSSLTSVIIPKSVSKIHNYAFSECPQLTIYCAHPSKPSDWHDNWNPDNRPVVWNHKPGASAPATKTPPQTIRYSQGLKFEKLADGMYAVKGMGTCTDTELVIPPTTPEGGRVTVIGRSAFRYYGSLTSVTIPDSVTAIGEEAFSGCSSLTSVTIPDSVTAIGKCAFYDCHNLSSVTVPDSVTAIEDYTFSGCRGLTSITIPDSVTTIGEVAFGVCYGLTSVNLPQSVENLGRNPFLCCSNLRTITVDPSNGKYYCQDNCVIDKESRKLVVGLQTSRIPDGVTTIGASAFACTNLTSITIPDSVTIIEELAFQFCESLTSITIPNSVTTIGQDAFYGCSGLTSIAIPNSVTTIGPLAFFGCSSLTSVTLPDSVTELDGTFRSCCSLTSITIPDSVTTIGKNAFSDCDNLTSVTIPDSVTTIGKDAFSDCDNLTSVTIPDSVTAMGPDVFSDCYDVTIYCAHPSKPSNWADDWNPDNRPVVWNYKPEGATSATKTSTETVRYSQGLRFKKLADGMYAVEGHGTCKDTELVIPPMTPKGGRVTAIGEFPFWNRRNLTSVTIPDSVTAIGKGAFNQCGSLTSITIPDSVTTIGASAFEGCRGLTSFTIPNGVTAIGRCAFGRCRGLTSITFPDRVTTIGRYAFSYCSNLTSITIPDSVTTIGKYAFSYCSNLTSVTIPDSVTAMGKGVFKACPNVTIYCAHPSKPSDWADDWNPDNRPVVWNHKPAVDPVDASQVDEMMTDTMAQQFVVYSDEKGGAGKMGIISTKVIGDAYLAGETVDLASLHARGLIRSDVGRIKILAVGTLDKPLTVKADAFSLQAVKMITLTGGQAIELKEP